MQCWVIPTSKSAMPKWSPLSRKNFCPRGVILGKGGMRATPEASGSGVGVAEKKLLAVEVLDENVPVNSSVGAIIFVESCQSRSSCLNGIGACCAQHDKPPRVIARPNNVLCVAFIVSSGCRALAVQWLLAELSTKCESGFKLLWGPQIRCRKSTGIFARSPFGMILSLQRFARAGSLNRKSLSRYFRNAMKGKGNAGRLLNVRKGYSSAAVRERMYCFGQKELAEFNCSLGHYERNCGRDK